jgi:GTP1/Obg family GTP-binding protein
MQGWIAGLLPRSDEERNSMEKLTLASMEHLPSAVILFVLDLSATSGVKSTVTSLSLPHSLHHSLCLPPSTHAHLFFRSTLFGCSQLDSQRRLKEGQAHRQTDTQTHTLFIEKTRQKHINANRQTDCQRERRGAVSLCAIQDTLRDCIC